MITNITLKNYRCFEKANIDLNLINIFVGGNTLGKSTLSFKAPKLLIENQGWSKTTTRHGETSAQVSIKTEKGSVTRKVKGNTRATTIVIEDEKFEYSGVKNLNDQINKVFQFNKNVDFKHFIKANEINSLVGVSGAKIFSRISQLAGYRGLSEAKLSFNTEISQHRKTLNLKLVPELVSNFLTHKELYKKYYLTLSLEQWKDFLKNKIDKTKILTKQYFTCQIQESYKDLLEKINNGISLGESILTSFYSLILNEALDNFKNIYNEMIQVLIKIYLQINLLTEKNQSLNIYYKSLTKFKQIEINKLLLNLDSIKENFKYCPTCGNLL